MIMKDIESFFQCENERSDAERKARLKEKGARMIVLET